MCAVCGEAGKTRFSVALCVIATSRLPESCLKTGNTSQTAVRGACGNGLYSDDLWLILSTPARSLTPLPWPSNTLPWVRATKIKRPDRAQPGSARPNPAQHNRPCVLRFVLASNEKQMDSEERTQKRRRERKRKKGSLVKYLRRKITQGGCLIISICLVWFCWGGHVVSLAAPWFIFHIIWSWMESKKEEGGFQGSVGRVGCLGSQWEGCGEVEGGLVSWSEMR